jgi:hypothetical protein
MSMIKARGSLTQSIAETDSKQNLGLISSKSFALLWRAFMVRKNEELDAEDAASTLFRFFRSKHVLDLKLIFGLTLVVLIIHVAVAIVFTVLALSISHAVAVDHSSPDASTSLATYLGPAIPVYGAILAWAYLTAGKRLGVVDLFACEIATVCRVGTIFNTGQNYVEKWRKMDTNNAIDVTSAHSNNFVSQEDYFPIFATNSHDLQALEALTVSHITEFYTYMKATRDSQRRLAELEIVEAAKEAVANMIYMLFLGYESGRKAINDLIEFQPTKTENIIVILLTELECYSFLCEHFKGDELRFQRLQLRETDYKDLVPRLLDEVNEPHERSERYWAPAQRMIPELQTRYDRALQAVQRCTRERAARSIE